MQAPTTHLVRRPSGRRLAYAEHGEGEPLVCPAWWVSHLENDWKQASFRQLSSMGPLRLWAMRQI